jgi:hypothetical protein
MAEDRKWKQLEAVAQFEALFRHCPPWTEEKHGRY